MALAFFILKGMTRHRLPPNKVYNCDARYNRILWFRTSRSAVSVRLHQNSTEPLQDTSPVMRNSVYICVGSRSRRGAGRESRSLDGLWYLYYCTTLAAYISVSKYVLSAHDTIAFCFTGSTILSNMFPFPSFDTICRPTKGTLF